ncbi:hypothetical protein [Mastigocoleus sp. MO_188.B34]|uniref:hypothetical protein n=1 Tax=Mastigocoleus sp. MO_188.B34 TaxID=3036635 RepID=UPI002622B3FC|nr:hypothetical protein [Mastigocoleus sp. MO_188.B34]MDJ0696247.1 hypothetical protein [Mastigocoleus sp. MO_188.B34]
MKFNSTSVTLLVPCLWQGIQYWKLRLHSGQDPEQEPEKLEDERFEVHNPQNRTST